jgi:hypothetical protein
MAGVFDRLHSEIGGEEEEGGLSILDLADLPPTQRKLMRLMLREVQLTYEELRGAVEAWPEAERMGQEELDEALDVLSKNLWLIRMGEEHITYRANLRRKPGSDVARSIWGDLDSRISRGQAPAEE